MKKDNELLRRARKRFRWLGFHGLARALVFNAVTVCNDGSYQGTRHRRHRLSRRVEGQGDGRVHARLLATPIEFPLPTGIDVAIDPKQLHLTISGIDKQKVGQVAADMRSLRKPDPYKNKGVRYMGEKLKKKVGKTGAKVSY